MYINFQKIISYIPSDVILSTCFQGSCGNFYKDIQLLSDASVMLSPCTIYIGCTSALRDNILPDDICLLLIEDSSFSISSSHIEYVVLQNSADTDSIYNAIKNHILIFSHKADVLYETLRPLCQNKDLSEILNTFYLFLENPISFHLLSDQKHLTLHTDFSSFSEDFKTIEKIFTNLHIRNKFRDSAQKNKERMSAFYHALLFKDMESPNYSLSQLTPSALFGDILGTITVQDINRPFGDLDAIYINILCEIVSQFFNFNILLQHSRPLRVQQDLNNLICGKSINNITSFCNVICGNLFQQFYVIIFRCSKGSPKMSNDILTLLFACFEHFIETTKDNAIVVLANIGKIEDYAKALSLLSTFAQKNDYSLGVSQLFKDLEQTQKYYHQALAVLTYGISNTSNHTDSSVFEFDVYKHELLFNALPNSFDKSLFLDSGIQSLEAMDKKNSSNYMKTIDCYIRNNCNRQKTCSDLYIHLNTFIQRQKKIEQILGRPINSTDFIVDYFIYKKLIR